MGLKWFFICSFLCAVLCSPVLAQSTIKPPLKGLIYAGDISFHKHDGGVPDNSLKHIYAKPGVLDGIVLNVSWAQLEPKRYEFETLAIDHALEGVRAYNKQFPQAPLAVRLRIYAGPSAPQWVKNLDGRPIKVQYRGQFLTIGRFWTPRYIKAWRHLQEELGRKYDNNPLVREVGMTSCSSVTSEPFVFPGGAVSLKNLHGAGFSDGAYERCLMQSSIDYLPWQKTRVEFPFNTFRLSNSRHLHPSPQITLKVMRHWRKEMGTIGVLSSHTFEVPYPKYDRYLYGAMKAMGPPIELQFNSSKGIDWPQAIRQAVDLNANAVEIWPETFQNISASKLKQWSVQIKHKSDN